MAYHDEKVKVVSEYGDTDTVYRYLRACRHCVSWEPRPRDDRGNCRKFCRSTAATCTTCDQFVATDLGLTQMWVETEAREGRMCKLTYKGKHYFVDRDEFVRLLGFDPDK